MVELPPDLQAWIDDITDKTKYPLSPPKNRIMIEALRAYRGVVDVKKDSFKPKRSDAAILAERDANALKISKREAFRKRKS